MVKIEFIAKYKNNRSYIQTVVSNVNSTGGKFDDTHVWQVERIINNLLEKKDRLKNVEVYYKKDGVSLDKLHKKSDGYAIEEIVRCVEDEGANSVAKEFIELFDWHLERYEHKNK